MNKSPLKSWIIANFEKMGDILIAAILLISILIHAAYGLCGGALYAYCGMQLLVLLFLPGFIHIAIGGRHIFANLTASIGVVGGLIYFAHYFDTDAGTSTYYWVLTTTIIATVIGGLTAFICSRYAYFNFDDVVSRYISFRNSDVNRFEDRWKYTINRFVFIFCYFIVSTAAITLDLSICAIFCFSDK